jgi:hypothetical protein
MRRMTWVSVEALYYGLSAFRCRSFCCSRYSCITRADVPSLVIRPSVRRGPFAWPDSLRSQERRLTNLIQSMGSKSRPRDFYGVTYRRGFTPLSRSISSRWPQPHGTISLQTSPRRLPERPRDSRAAASWAACPFDDHHGPSQRQSRGKPAPPQWLLLHATRRR